MNERCMNAKPKLNRQKDSDADQLLLAYLSHGGH
jgi:hypothetical protein